MKNQGFTLIEIMIVLGILGAMLTLGVPRLMKSDNKIKSVVRKFTVISKELHNRARLKNRTYRIVFELNEEGGKNYWIESRAGIALLNAEKEEPADNDDEEAKEKQRNGFELDTEVLKEKQQLPGNIYFSHIENILYEEAVTEDMAYVHYFPQGLVEESAIHFTNKENINWTIYIHPLTGRGEIFPRNIPLKELTIAEEN